MSERHRGFLPQLLIELGRGLGRGLGLVVGTAALGAGAGAIGAAIYGVPMAAGAIVGVIAVAGIALFIFLAGQFF